MNTTTVTALRTQLDILNRKYAYIVSKPDRSAIANAELAHIEEERDRISHYISEELIRQRTR